MPLTPRTQNRSEPVCGHCGYCVRGISQLICPECGSDLREVGIVAPNARRSDSPICLGNLVDPAASRRGFSPLSAASGHGPPVRRAAKEHQANCLPAPYLNITLDLDAEGWPWQPAIIGAAPFHPDRFTLSNHPLTIFLEAHVASGNYHYWSTSGTRLFQTSGFNATAIASWLAVSGVNAGDPNVRALCDQIFKIIMQMHQGTGWASTPLLDANGTQVGVAKPSTNWVVHDQPHPFLIMALYLFWLIVYCVGLAKILRNERAAHRSSTKNLPTEVGRSR